VLKGDSVKTQQAFGRRHIGSMCAGRVLRSSST
jgi:hypothetical protein